MTEKASVAAPKKNATENENGNPEHYRTRFMRQIGHAVLLDLRETYAVSPKGAIWLI